jgi:iron-sulfur cluster insertion protein
VIQFAAPVGRFDCPKAAEYTVAMSTSTASPLPDLAPPSVLVFTDAAADKVGELIKEEDNPNLKLRVFVSGGGCSGFQYGFTFDENMEEGDFCVENRGVQLLVDPMSAQYLMGAEIDYKEDLQGAQFVIRNPNAKTTCGCGSSFSA